MTECPLPGLTGQFSRSFDDPDQYQSAIRGGDRHCIVLGPGTFRAELTTIEVGRLKLQRGREDLPRLASSATSPNEVTLLGWPGNGPLPVVRGLQMRPGEWMCLGPGTQSHHRTFERNDFVALTISPGNLTRAAIDLTGRELTATAGNVMRPPEQLGAWLMAVIEAATRVGRTAPNVFTSPLAGEALEQALLRPMIMLLQHGEASNEAASRGRHVVIARRFEEVVHANADCSLLIGDLCRLTGASGRTLRTVCQEQLGMSPHQFITLRRLHLARRALLRADRQSETVTNVATAHGFWELGRFAVTYKSLFGESPSATLRRPIDAPRA